MTTPGELTETLMHLRDLYQCYQGDDPQRTELIEDLRVTFEFQDDLSRSVEYMCSKVKTAKNLLYQDRVMELLHRSTIAMFLYFLVWSGDSETCFEPSVDSETSFAFDNMTWPGLLYAPCRGAVVRHISTFFWESGFAAVVTSLCLRFLMWIEVYEKLMIWAPIKLRTWIEWVDTLQTRPPPVDGSNGQKLKAALIHGAKYLLDLSREFLLLCRKLAIYLVSYWHYFRTIGKNGFVGMPGTEPKKIGLEFVTSIALTIIGWCLFCTDEPGGLPAMVLGIPCRCAKVPLLIGMMMVFVPISVCDGSLMSTTNEHNAVIPHEGLKVKWTKWLVSRLARLLANEKISDSEMLKQLVLEVFVSFQARQDAKHTKMVNRLMISVILASLFVAYAPTGDVVASNGVVWVIFGLWLLGHAKSARGWFHVRAFVFTIVCAVSLFIECVDKRQGVWRQVVCFCCMVEVLML